MHRGNYPSTEKIQENATTFVSFFYQLFLFCTHFWRTSRPYFSARFSPCSFLSLVHFFTPGIVARGACYISLARVPRSLACSPRDNPEGMARAVCSFLSAGQARKNLELIRGFLILRPNITPLYLN